MVIVLVGLLVFLAFFSGLPAWSRITKAINYRSSLWFVLVGLKLVGLARRRLCRSRRRWQERMGQSIVLAVWARPG